MEIVWMRLIVGGVVLLIGLAFIFARAHIARFAAFRQRAYYPEPARRLLRVQAKALYYLVLGFVLVLIGIVVVVISFHR